MGREDDFSAHGQARWLRVLARGADDAARGRARGRGLLQALRCGDGGLPRGAATEVPRLHRLHAVRRDGRLHPAGVRRPRRAAAALAERPRDENVHARRRPRHRHLPHGAQPDGARGGRRPPRPLHAPARACSALKALET